MTEPTTEEAVATIEELLANFQPGDELPEPELSQLRQAARVLIDYFKERGGKL